MNINNQIEFRPHLLTVYGPKTYQKFRNQLIKIDELLLTSGIENKIIFKDLRKHKKKNPT